MKKLICLLFVLCIACVAYAKNEAGVGLKLGKAAKVTNLDSAKRDISNTSNTSPSLTDAAFLFGADVFFEHSFNKTFVLGGKLGYETAGKDELKFRISYPSYYAGNYRLKVDQDIFPLSLYGKINLSRLFNVYGGGGFSLAFSTLEDGPKKYKDNKIFPHIVFGSEIRVSKSIGLGVDFKYSTNAKLDGHGYPQIFSKDIMLDLNGLSYAIQFRYYFDVQDRAKEKNIKTVETEEPSQQTQ
jgi:hypothetical protein